MFYRGKGSTEKKFFLIKFDRFGSQSSGPLVEGKTDLLLLRD